MGEPISAVVMEVLICEIELQSDVISIITFLLNQ